MGEQMLEEKNKLRADVWSRYWSSGAIQSCTIGALDNTPVERFWLESIESLKSGSKILDLCTGSGALANYISELIEKFRPEISDTKICGVDLASLDNINSTKNNVELIGRIDIAQLPFSDNSFDVIVSQYGVEYTINKEVLREIKRVIKSSGQFYFLMHSDDSIMIQNAKDEIKSINWVLGEVDFLPTVEKVLPYLAKLKNPGNAAKLLKDSSAVKARDRFNSIMQLLEAEIIKSKQPVILKECINITSNICESTKKEGLKVGKELLRKYQVELGDYLVRLEEMQEVALSSQGIKSLEKLVNAVGLNFSAKKIISKNSVLGYCVCLD